VTEKEAIEVLLLFNKKAAWLLQSSFVQTSLQQGQQFSLEFAQGKPLKMERSGPAGESIDAFVLTFRLFIQRNDRCSVKKLRDAYEVLPLAEDRKVELRELCAQWEGLRDFNTWLTLDGERLTYGRIMDVFIYGGLAHSDAKLTPTYDQWMSGPSAGMLEYLFCKGLSDTLGGIQILVECNVEALDLLGK
jgi:hypothetical protein